MHELAKRAKEQLLDHCVSPEGWFYASGLQNSGQGDYHTLFGRDAGVVCLLLEEYTIQTGDLEYLPHIRRTLEKLADTAGRRENRQNGEFPGWVIHELRTEHHEYLTERKINPWPMDEDGVMRIYESVDSTPLYLIALFRYWEITRDDQWLGSQMYAVKNALTAIINHGDNDRDGLVDYGVPRERKSGGLALQSWMDSTEIWEGPLVYPIAPVEVQGYVWLAFRLWARYFLSHSLEHRLVQWLDSFSEIIEEKIWRTFAVENDTGIYLAANRDGEGRLIPGACSSMGHLLWSVNPLGNGDAEGLFGKVSENPEPYTAITLRLLSEDLFDPQAGIRTLSSQAGRYDPKKYHCGAIWPHDNALICLGLKNCGFKDEAVQVARAVFTALEHFDAPGMELYYHTEVGYGEFRHDNGNPANRIQAWALAGVLAMDAVILAG